MEKFTAYNVKTKEKNVPMKDVRIDATTNGKRNTYIAKGTSEDGTSKLTKLVSLETATKAFEAGTATRGTGWGNS